MSHIGTEVGVADAVLLPEVSEDSFVANLRERFEAKQIYTYIGEVLISVNPYADLGLYNQEDAPKFRHKAIYQMPPHVYALSDSVYSTMCRTHSDTVVIISGESGAGKTEASKHVMEYIAAINTAHHREEIERVKDLLLASTPILEAFGNAQTTVNDNSSRFGKYMDIIFDFKFDPIGGHILNYLLEKGRVVSQNAGERNFHFFYQLLAGADAATLASLHLSNDIGAYNYLKNSVGSNASDAKHYADAKKAMKTIGFSSALINEIQSIVAAVLLVGNVEFQGSGESCSISTKDVVANIADLLKTDVAALSKALTTRVVAARGEIYEKPLTATQAAVARDALARSLYDSLFTFLVTKINESIGIKGGKHTSLGVLDIYGFEIFGENGFDQFCINYCNEKLQQVFIELVLKMEQEEYAREGIDWVKIEYFNNEEICRMIDDPKKGMIGILDEQCSVASGSDSAFLAHLDAALATNQRYASHKKDPAKSGCERERDFKICHFAGDVVYSTIGFVEKNNDTLFHDLKRMLYECEQPSLKQMYPEGSDPLTAVHKIPPTAATSFRTSMDQLVQILTKKYPFYIRCIKPNASKTANKWEEKLCIHQVRYLGLIENLRVRRAGYCNRQPYEVFLERYKMICDATWPNWREDPKDGVKKIIEAVGLMDGVAFGKTKLFIRLPQSLTLLEQKREEALPKVVARIQAYYRGYRARKLYRQLRAIYKIIAFWHAAHMRKYIALVGERFQGVAEMADFGRSVNWPETPPGLNEAVTYMKKIHHTWRARKILDSYTPEQKKAMEQKVLASDLLQGRRQFWGFQYEWQGNYLAKGSNAEKFASNLQTLMEKHGDTKVFFSSRVKKLNTKGKEDDRALVITDKHLYRLHAKTYKLRKFLPLDQVVGLAMSAGEDQACVVRTTIESDIVVTLRGDACSAELASLLARAKGDQHFPIDVAYKIPYRVKGVEKSLEFKEEDAASTAFKRRSSGYTLITRKASLIRMHDRAPASAPAAKRLGEIKE